MVKWKGFIYKRITTKIIFEGNIINNNNTKVISAIKNNNNINIKKCKIYFKGNINGNIIVINGKVNIENSKIEFYKIIKGQGISVIENINNSIILYNLNNKS